MQNYFILYKNSILIALVFLFIEFILCITRGEYYMRGWQKAETKDILFHAIAFFVLLFCYIKKIKNIPNFLHCKKCKKVYNYTDVKDKNGICPKCKGELQDYKEFENKNR